MLGGVSGAESDPSRRGAEVGVEGVWGVDWGDHKLVEVHELVRVVAATLVKLIARQVKADDFIGEVKVPCLKKRHGLMSGRPVVVIKPKVAVARAAVGGDLGCRRAAVSAEELLKKNIRFNQGRVFGEAVEYPAGSVDLDSEPAEAERVAEVAATCGVDDFSI